MSIGSSFLSKDHFWILINPLKYYHKFNKIKSMMKNSQQITSQNLYIPNKKQK